MLVRYPKMQDRQGIYELYYLHHVSFARLDEGSPRSLKRAQSRAAQKKAFAKVGSCTKIVSQGGRRLKQMVAAKAIRSGDKVRG